jgi:hypothetical protein
MTMQDLYDEMKRALPALGLAFADMQLVKVSTDDAWMIFEYGHTRVSVKLPSA